MEPRRQLLGLPRALEIDVHEVGDRDVVRLEGDLDLHTATALREVLAARPAVPGRLLLVDLVGVTFLDSVAMGVLVGALNRLRSEDGALELVCGDDRLLRLFRITELDAVFRIHPDLATALG